MRTMNEMTLVALVAMAMVAAGCGLESTPIDDPPDDPPELPDVGEQQRMLVGAEGGTVALGDLELAIPAGALTQETEITVTVVEDAAPSSFSTYSPLFQFEPAGLQFDAPLTVRLPFDGDDEHATIFWTAATNGAFVAMPTRVEDGTAITEVSHFSGAFVGSGCEGEDCCGAANGELDVLLMVDNSNSMSEEQAALAEQIPRMARVLATGDLDNDGEQDFPALHSVRLGVVSSDMGSGGYRIQTCDNSEVGDDGVLQTTGRLVDCEASYPPFAELRADDDAEAIDSFVEHVECIGRLGTGGCGFEQQLEASLVALTEQTEPGMPNEGFVRDDSILAVVMLTDEGDCSTGNPNMFNPADETFGPLNVRCSLSPDELYPVDRYIDGLQSLRSAPDDMIFSVVAGVPTDLVEGGGPTDFDAIFADERMIPTIDPSNPNEIQTSCETAMGRAYPAPRMVEVASAFGANGVVQSICQDDFTPVIGAILDRVASRARGECVPTE